MKESPAPPKRGPFLTVQGERVVLKADGRWFSNGSEITHQKTCEAFFKHIGFDEEKNHYYVHIGYERLYIDVEDTAYFVKDIQDRELIMSNDKAYLTQNCSFSYEEKTGSLYVETQDHVRAKCLRHVHYFLLSHYDEKASTIALPGQIIKVRFLK